MDIVNLSEKIYSLLINMYLDENEKVKQLQEGIKLVSKETLINVLTYSHNNIPESAPVFSPAQLIQLKSMLFKLPFAPLILDKIGDFSFIYTDKMYFNLLSTEDVEYYLKRDENFLNKKINNSENCVMKYLFVSSQYTSFDTAINLFKNKDHLITSENKQAIGDYLKDNKEYLMKNYKNNIFNLLLLPDEILNVIFEGITEKDRMSYILQHVEAYKMDSMLEKFMENEDLNKDSIDYIFMLNLFFDNNIRISKKNLMDVMKLIDESKMKSLLEFPNHNYLARNSDVLEELKTKYRAFGNSQEQTEFTEKVLKKDFKPEQSTSTVLFFNSIPSEYIMSKKMQEMKLFLKVLGSHFSKENVSLLIQNITELKYNELEQSSLLKDIKLITALVKAESYVTEEDIYSRTRYFLSQFEQRSLLDAIVNRAEPKLHILKKRL